MSVTNRSVAVIDLGDFFQPGFQHTTAMFAQRELGGQSLVTRIAQRLKACQRVDDVAIVGSNLPIKMLVQNGNQIATINMPSCHASERLGAAADRCKAEWIVYVPVTRPFVDSQFVDELLSHVDQDSICDYIGFTPESGDLSVNQTVGLFGEVCHIDALRRIRRNSPPTADSERPLVDSPSLVRWLQRGEGAFHLKLVNMPKQLQKLGLRLSLECEDDWDAAERLCDSIDLDNFHWKQIAKAVRKDAQLKQTMLCEDV